MSPSIRRVFPLAKAHLPLQFPPRSLRHSFLVVRGRGEYEGMEFIVEPALRAHFTIPHPSPDYEQMLARAPDVFVGGSCRLAPLVQLLCALMADSFERQGLALPPWRKEAAMLSKWLPAAARTRELRPVTHSRTGAGAVPSAEPSNTGYGFAPAVTGDCLNFTGCTAVPGSRSASPASAAAAPDGDAPVAGGSPISVFAVTGAFSPVSRLVGAGGLNAGPHGFGAIAAAAALPTGMPRCPSEPPVLQFGFQLPAAPAVSVEVVAAEQLLHTPAPNHQQHQQQAQAQGHKRAAEAVPRAGRSTAAVPYVTTVASKGAATAVGYAAWGALPATAATADNSTAGLVAADVLAGSISAGDTAAMSVGGASCCDCGCGSADGSTHSALDLGLDLGLGLGCMTDEAAVREGVASSRYGGAHSIFLSLGTGVLIDCCGEDEDEDEAGVEVAGGLLEMDARAEAEAGQGRGQNETWYRSTATGMLPAPCAGEGGRRSLDAAKALLLDSPCAAAAAAAASTAAADASGCKRPRPRRQQPGERDAMPGGGLAAMMAAAATAAPAAAASAAGLATAAGVVERRPPVHPAAPAIHLVRRRQQPQPQEHDTAAAGGGNRSGCGSDAAAAPVTPPLQPQQQQQQQLQPGLQLASARPHSQAEHPLQQQVLAFQRLSQHSGARAASGQQQLLVATHPIAAAATAATAAAVTASAAAAVAGMRALNTAPPLQAADKSWLPWKLPAHYGGDGVAEADILVYPVSSSAAAVAAIQYGQPRAAAPAGALMISSY